MPPGGLLDFSLPPESVAGPRSHLPNDERSVGQSVVSAAQSAAGLLLRAIYTGGGCLLLEISQSCKGEFTPKP